MQEPITHTIPLKVLRACALSVAKQDVRAYLCYVKVEHGFVASTDGHRLLVCDIDGLDKDLNIFISPEHIKALHIGLKQTDKDGDVEIMVKKYDDETIVTMTYDNRTIKFINANAGKFPNVKASIPSDDKIKDCMPRFNVNYILDMQKAADIISGKKPCNMDILPTGKDTPMIIKFPNTEFKITGVVMPIRS